MAKEVWEPEDDDKVLVDGRIGKVVRAEDAIYQGGGEWEIAVEFEEEDEEENQDLVYNEITKQWEVQV